MEAEASKAKAPLPSRNLGSPRVGTLDSPSDAATWYTASLCGPWRLREASASSAYLPGTELSCMGVASRSMLGVDIEQQLDGLWVLGRMHEAADDEGSRNMGGGFC